MAFAGIIFYHMASAGGFPGSGWDAEEGKAIRRFVPEWAKIFEEDFAETLLLTSGRL